MSDRSIPLLQEAVPCSPCRGAKVLLLSLLIGLGFAALLWPVPVIQGWGGQHVENAITMVGGPVGLRGSGQLGQAYNRAFAMGPLAAGLSGSQPAPRQRTEEGFKAEPYAKDAGSKFALLRAPHTIAEASGMGLGRRGMLTAALAAALGTSQGTVAKGTPPPDVYDVYTTMPEFTIPAMKTGQYMDLLNGPKYDEAHAELTKLVDNGKYYEAGMALLLDDFDSVRQSCYFLPYALMKEGDPEAGGRMKGHYAKVKDQLEAFDMTMQKAERLEVTENEAEKALDNLLGELNVYRGAARRLKRSA